MKEQTAYEEMQVRKIEEWKGEEIGGFSRKLGALFRPVGNLIDAVIPQSALEHALDGIGSAGNFLTDEKDILKGADVSAIHELRTKDLAVSDHLANEVHNMAILMAAGAGGLITPIVADIPALLVLSMRTIHKIGLCYGYETNTAQEQLYALQILSIVAANSTEEKRAAIDELTLLKAALRSPQNALIEKDAQDRRPLLIHQLCRQLGTNLAKRKAAQLIPGVGTVVAIAVNGSFIRDLGYATIRSYQERWLTDNDKWSYVG